MGASIAAGAIRIRSEKKRAERYYSVAVTRRAHAGGGDQLGLEPGSDRRISADISAFPNFADTSLGCTT